eukprot:jgi/Chrpa1/24000/Chrysochromulina_OHIO_Genome00023070-RA
MAPESADSGAPPRQRDLHMALQAVSEAIEKLAATDGLEARRDALALLLDTCESCYGKDAVALGNVMRSNEGRGLRVLCELLNLCHDRAWSSWLLQHGAERRLEELSRSSDATIQRYASGTLMNVSSSTHATLAGGAQAAVAQRLHDAAVESFAYARAAPRQRATGEQAAAAATLEKAAAERAAAAAEGAAASTPAAQQRAAAEQAAADGRTVSEEAAAIRVQAIVRGNADRQTAAAEAAAERPDY